MKMNVKLGSVSVVLASLLSSACATKGEHASAPAKADRAIATSENKDSKSQVIERTNPNMPVVYFFYLTGGPIDIFSHDSADKLGNDAVKVAQDNGAGVRYRREWHNQSTKLCNELAVQLESEHPPYRVVIMGHSWGSSSAVTMAHCLQTKQIPVDVLVNIDSIQAPNHVRAAQIPQVVKLNYNFFENQAVLQGVRKNFFVDSAKKPEKSLANSPRIRNIQVVSHSADPHTAIDDHLAGVISRIVALQVNGDDTPLDIPSCLDSRELEKGNFVKPSRGCIKNH